MAEPRDSSSITRRRDHYNSQRTSTSRSSTSNTQNRSSYQGHRQPDTYWNLDEAAVSPPVSNLEDRESRARRSPLEENIRDQVAHSGTSQTETVARVPSRHERNVSHPRRTSDESYELTEIAALPPVQRDASNRNRQGSLEGQHYHGNDEETAEEASIEDTGPYHPRTPAEYIPQQHAPKETPKWLTELYTISYLIFFAILGTLARLGVQWVTFYPGTPIVTPVIWANFAGSFIMGFLAEDQALFRFGSPSDSRNGIVVNEHIQPKNQTPTEDQAAHAKRKKTIPLYIGLATGFCGSFTSFSSFARDYFLALSNDLPTPLNHPVSNPSAALIQSTAPRNGGYSFEAWLHVVLATLALSIGGLLTGAQVAIFVARGTPRVHSAFVQRVVDPAVVVLGWGCWLGAVFMAIWPPDRGQPVEMWRGEVLFAIVFAPAGCLLRFYISLKLNGLVPAFPLGTFTVNMLGTAILGLCWDIQHVRIGIMGRVGGGITGCQVSQGVMDGFCGCLTTVSTWVVEINGLKRKHGWMYAFASVIGGLGLMVVIMGSVRWSEGWQDPVCATGYTGKIYG